MADTPTPAYSVPWTILDTWIAVGLLVLLNIGLLGFILLVPMWLALVRLQAAPALLFRLATGH